MSVRAAKGGTVAAEFFLCDNKMTTEYANDSMGSTGGKPSYGGKMIGVDPFCSARARLGPAPA
jgi:hypothetical protein